VSDDLYFMSPPTPAWSLRGRANFRSRAADPVRPLRARKEWLGLARAIEAEGGRVAVLESDDDGLTGMPYAAEAGHVLPPRSAGHRPRFLLPRMKSEHRKPERDAWAPFVRSLGFEPVELERGVWEAQGDVAEFDGTTLLFYGGRTDLDGLNAALAHFDGEVMVLEVREPAFHGNMAALPIPAADRLLVCSDVVVGDGVARLLRRFGGGRVEHVEEEEIRAYASNGLPVGGAWLVPSVVPDRIKSMVAGWGVRVVELPMRELCEKAGGASRCLVCRAPGAAAWVSLPTEHRLDAVARVIDAEPDDG